MVGDQKHVCERKRALTKRAVLGRRRRDELRRNRICRPPALGV